MKRFLLLLLALLLSVTIFAQNRISYISEHFDSDDLPTNWTFEGEGTSNWEIWKTHQAGGNPNEIKLYWKPSFEGTARMVSPAINLTGISEMVVSFKAFLDNYKDSPHKMGVATTSDNGATWNTAWENTYASHNQGQHNIIETVSTPDMGKENVKFCIYFSGTSGNINGWYFDDIEIYTLDELNLGLMSIDMPEIANTKDNEIAFTVKNTGEETITSFTACYQIDENEVVTQAFETALVSLAVENVSFQEKVTLTPGSHKLTISIVDVNGKEDVKSDNVIESDIIVPLGKVQRMPMIEHFSSSACVPSANVNQQMKKLTDNNPGKYVYTKYVMNWPSPGDPYYTAEGGKRKDLYNINATPSLIYNRSSGHIAITQEELDAVYNMPAFIELKGAFNVNNNTININVDVMPLVNLYNKRLFVSVNEKTTTGNVGINGEKEFYHIMMKMLPNAEGTVINLIAGEMQHFDFTYNMNGTFVEEMEDLEVAVWIQDYENHNEIYNSNYLYEYSEHPYPVENLKLTDNKGTLSITWDAPKQGNPIGYNIYINDILAAEKYKGLSYSIKTNGLTTVKVVAVYENGKTSVGTISANTDDNATTPEVLEVPTNLRATVVQNDPKYNKKFKITLTWDNIPSAERYDVYASTQYVPDGFCIGNTTTNEFVCGSDIEGELWFTVRAVYNDTIVSDHSEPCHVILEEEINQPSSSLIFFYEGNEITNTVNDIFLERDINDALEIQFDLVVGNNTANDMNVVCEKEDLSNVGQSYICWGNCYMPGTTMATNTVYAGGNAIFNGHTMFVDEEWNELPKGTVIPVRYTFYDEKNPSEKYVFNVKFIYENDDTANYWTPDESLYANNMTIITTVEIDGEEQYNPNLELGAFCNGELRGSARLQYVDAPANRYECFLMVYGNSGDDITFRLYDHSTGLESDLKSNEVVDFEVNASIGDVVSPYSINFVSTVLHSRDLTSGWNWYSTYIINEGAEGLANLEAAVGTNGIQIKNQTKFVNQASGNWYGTLTSTAVEDMFMIQMSAAHTLNLEGYVVNPAEHPITLGTNWKWISYPVANSMSVEEAFASANPSNGDYVKSQKGFAQYYEGLGWSGTLQVMTPGMGYMYQNTSGYAKTLVYPMANAKSKAEAEVEENLHWTANATKYPMNMTVIAVVEDAARDYEVAAFSNGECRGSARPIYIEALGQSMIFMTIYGDDNDNVSFRYYDVTTGEEVALNDEMTFEVNATHGDVMEPYVMTLSTMGIDEASAGFNIYPNPVQDKLYIEAEAEIEEIVVYDVYGRRQVTETPSHQGNLSVDVSNLNSGVYFVQIKTVEGNITKRFVKE